MYTDITGYSWKSFWNKVGNWVSNTLGITVSSETSTLDVYFFAGEVVSGVGESSNSEKPANITLSAPKEFWKFWEYSIGLDVNINGKGCGVYLGGESGISFTSGNQAFDISVNQLGRIGFKLTTFDNHGNYSYSKLDINGPEIAAVVLLAIFAPEILPTLAPAFLK